jgi:hypothetical protein
VAGEERARRPDQARSTRSEQAGRVALGLVPAPDIPEKIARELTTELPELLGRHVDDRVSWDVSVVADPLTGTGREAPEILDACHERLRQEGWDLAICLTGLPVYRSGYLVLADVRARSARSRRSRCPSWGRHGCVHGCGRRSSSSSKSCTPGTRSSQKTSLPQSARRGMPRRKPERRARCPAQDLTASSRDGSPSS